MQRVAGAVAALRAEVRQMGVGIGRMVTRSIL